MKDIRSLIQRSDKKARSEMQNIMGMVITNINTGRISGILQFLAKNADVSIQLATADIQGAGKEQLAEQFRKAEQGEKNDRFELHLLHSPCFLLPGNDEKELPGEASWDTYSFLINATEQTCSPMLTRIHATFFYEEGRIRIQSLDWFILQTWLPEKYEIIPMADRKLLSCIRPVQETLNHANNTDFLKIQKTVNRFIHEHMYDAAELFNSGEDSRFLIDTLFKEEQIGIKAIRKKLNELKKKEQKNDEDYICLMLNTSPIIHYLEDRDIACLSSWVETAEVKGAAFNVKVDELFVERNICHLEVTLIRDGNSWKMTSFEMKKVFHLPAVRHEARGILFERMSVKGNTWQQPPMIMGEKTEDDFLIDYHIIENLVMGWVYAIRVAGCKDFFKRYMKNDQVSYKMLFCSRGLDTLPLQTDDEILQRIGMFDKDLKFDQPGYHTVSTPLIEISSDGKNAEAVWMEHCNTNMSVAFGTSVQPNAIPYFTNFSRYHHSFTKVNGEWIMSAWRFEPLLSIRQHTYDPANARGLCAGEYKGDVRKQQIPYFLLEEKDLIGNRSEP